MVDVERRVTNLTPAHAAGLRRLSTRAATSPAPTPTRNGLLPLAPLAESLLAHLRSSGVPILPGLSDADLARAEAELGFPFPPDLRAVLSLGLPSGPGFPDWRRLRSSSLSLPIAAASLQVARGSLWPRTWGPRPSDPSVALRSARAALRRAPSLIPLFGRCYLPARPSLAGNPVFLVSDDHISCCALDLADFFRRALALPPSSDLSLRRQRSAGPPEKPPPAPSSRRSLDSVAGKNPRWIEFWSDASSDCRRRSSSSPEPSPQCFLEIRPQRLPTWVGGYLDRIGSVLKSGGWDESDIREIIHVSSSGMFNGDDAIVLDDQSIRDALLLKTDRCSDSLRRAGWSSDEVNDALSLDFRKERICRPPVKLPPGIAFKIGQLADAVSRS
ncbi:hypothetical protein J5N97_009284 [Dioscorea zingiberensis]|uniref:Knr4/Smi1-like domain-containing protein n=1 Tax=Dioscorea zingiberensis TaxID=325984 RepID=A0A9D5CXZ4_9LILI|nr:hypothetical protein J5N97_009284 [Dioscorea zingiberensis]